MKVKLAVLPLLVVGIFWGIIGASMLTGTWQSNVSEAEMVVDSTDDIKGWMTLEDISGDFNMPVAELVRVLGLPVNTDAGKSLKDIAADNSTDADQYRDTIKTYIESKNGN